MEKSRRIQIDPLTKNTRLEIVNTLDVKSILDEESLTRKKEYLESSIAKFQGELDQVNADLSIIEQEKDGAK